MRGIAVLLALAGLTGCGDDVPPAAGTEGGSTGAAEGETSGSETGAPVEPTFVVRFDDGRSELSLLADDEPLLRFEADAWQIGMTSEVNEALSYDPVHEMEVQWVAPESVTRAGDEPLRLELDYDGGVTMAVEIGEDADGRFSATWRPLAGAELVAAYRMRARIDSEEGLYGLGEHFDAPNNRGRVRAMQIESDLSFEPGHNEVHVPVPFVTGTRGWGLFVADDHPAIFDCATSDDTLLEVTFGVGPHADRGLAFHLFGAAHPLDVTRHYYDVTGYPKRPSAWAIGPWIWRNENEDQAQVLSDVHTLRELDLPASGLWIDRPYATGVNTFDFEPSRYPDPAAMLDEVHELGLRTALWHTPYVSDDEEPALALHEEAVAMGYYPPTIGLVLSGWGPLVDLTNAAAWDWWQSLLSRYADMGIEGYKLDYAEEIVPGLGPARLPWVFADGSDERTMQAAYQRLYHEVYDQMLPPDGGFLLVRAGTWGDQVYSSVVWPGDLDADMGLHLEVVDGTKRSGGLPAAVAAGSSLGPSGYPLFASDTGGYKGGAPNKETFTRWFQHTALTPVMQIGTARSNVAWEYDEENGFDDEMLGWYREFTRLHLRLFPYLWTHVHRVADDGRPIVRAVGLAYPELAEHPDFDYMLGDDLLVAPVVEAGATTRELVVPPGTWLDWFSGEELSGPGRATVDAPLSKLPLYLREGAIVPMLRPTIDSLSPTTRPDEVDSYDTDPGIVHVRVRPGAPSSFELFDGSTIAQGRDELAWALRLHGGTTFSQGWAVEAVGLGGAPTRVLVDNVELAVGQWTYGEGVGGTLRLMVPKPDAVVIAYF